MTPDVRTRVALAWFAALATAVAAVAFAVVAGATGTHGAPPPSLATAVVVDLVVVLPVAAWALVHRVGRLPAHWVAGVPLVGLVLAHLALPGGSAALSLAEAVVGGVELVVLGTLLLRARRVVAAYRHERARTPYLGDALRAALGSAITSRIVVDLLTAELSVVLALVRRRRFDAPAGAGVFGWVVGSGHRLLVTGLGAATVVELVAVHVLVTRWSPTAAWVLTGLSAYSLLWLLADLRVARLHPHLVTEGLLRLRAGARTAADVPVSAVVGTARWRADVQVDARIGAGTPGVVLTLGEPVVVRRMLGRDLAATTLAVAVDDPRGLLHALRVEQEATGDPGPT